MFNIEDKIWDLVMKYNTLIGNKSVAAGLDLYGTEQKLNVALSLTIAHQLQKLTEAIKEQTKQDAKLSRK